MQWNPRLVRAGLILWKRFDELNRPQVLFVEDALFVHTEVYRVLDRGPPVRSVAGGCYDGIVIDWSSCPAVERDPSKVSGAWVFRGTRVPVAALFENLEGGASITEFVEWFPGVTIERARAVFEHAARSALAPV